MIRGAILLFVAFFAFDTAAACVCPGEPGNTAEHYVNARLAESVAVFRGKVVGFEYRKGVPNEFAKGQLRGEYETLVIKFEVDRFWKGSLTGETFLVTDETRAADGTSTGSSCDYSFSEGESYLVYAGSRDGFYRTHACSGTRPLKSAGGDLKILGEGKIVEKPKPQGRALPLIMRVKPVATDFQLVNNSVNVY